MDRVVRYRQIVRGLIEEYARYKFSHGDIDNQVIMDRERDRYLLMAVGWDRERRVYHTSIHLDIIGGKVWLQHDATDCAIAEELMAAGIPKEDIVLAFHPADVRPHTGFAVG